MRILLAGVMFLLAQQANAVDCGARYGELQAARAEAVSRYQESPAEAKKSLVNLDEELSRILTDCRDSAQLYALAAETKISLGKNAEALKYAQAAHDIDAESWEANHALGTILTLEGQPEAGISYLEKAAADSPYRERILLNICSTYELMGRFPEAVATCSKVLEGEDPKVVGPAYYIRGRAYEALGETAKSRSDFAKARSAGFKGAEYYTDDHHRR